MLLIVFEQFCVLNQAKQSSGNDTTNTNKKSNNDRSAVWREKFKVWAVLRLF
jgi:hypothetical protein